MYIYSPGAFRAFVAASICALSVHASAGEKKAAVIINPDEARIVRLPQGTQTLIIGNPLIADVTLLKSNAAMVVTGKSYGVTNMIALDGQGNAVDETVIQVADRNHYTVVYRGGDKESYSCSPICAPTVALGDNPAYMQQVIGAAQARNGASAGGVSSGK